MKQNICNYSQQILYESQLPNQKITPEHSVSDN